MKKKGLWGMVGLSVGLAALLAGCSTTGMGPAPVGERTAAPSPGLGRSYDLMARGWERGWPYGPNVATPSLW